MLGDRLKSARSRQQLTLEQLSEKMDNLVTKQALSQFEKGSKNPSGKVLKQLCKSLNVTREYLLRPDSVKIENIEFRKRSSRLAKYKQTNILSTVQDYIERYLELEDIIDNAPEFENPLSSYKVINTAEDAEAAANEVRSIWNLGHDSIERVLEMLETKEIKVFTIEADDAFSGVSGLANDKYPFIVVNKNMSADHIRFTALHEFAHLIMDIGDEDNEEKLCDRFAGAFIFSKEAVLEEFGDKPRKSFALEEVLAIKQKYGTSIAAIMYRMSDLDLITQDYLRRFFIYRNQQGWQKNEPGKLKIPEIPQRFERLLMRAYVEGHITASKAAELSGGTMKVYEVMEKYKGVI